MQLSDSTSNFSVKKSHQVWLSKSNKHVLYYRIATFTRWWSQWWESNHVTVETDLSRYTHIGPSVDSYHKWPFCNIGLQWSRIGRHMCIRGSDITFSPSPSVEEVLDSRPSRYDCAIEVASQRNAVRSVDRFARLHWPCAVQMDGSAADALIVFYTNTTTRRHSAVMF